MGQARLRRPEDLKGRPFPQAPLFGAGAIVAFAIGAIAFGQMKDVGVVRSEIGEPAAIRDIRLARDAAGMVRVSDATTGTEIAAYAEGQGGFVSGSVRGLDRIRFAAQAEKDAPYRLIRWTSGAVSLSDTATGERIYLNAFGPDNAAAFARLLDDRTGDAR